MHKKVQVLARLKYRCRCLTGHFKHWEHANNVTVMLKLQSVTFGALAVNKRNWMCHVYCAEEQPELLLYVYVYWRITQVTLPGYSAAVPTWTSLNSQNINTYDSEQAKNTVWKMDSWCRLLRLLYKCCKFGIQKVTDCSFNKILILLD